MQRMPTRFLVGLALLLSGAAWTQAAEKPATARPVDKPLENTLRWRTSDVDSRGFDVYRGESEGGPFVKLTAQPIDGHVRAGQSGFSYVDDTIEPGKAYWYYVEVIDVLGARRRFTPVIEAPAKGAKP